jgi:hypothetical protein
MFAMITVPAYVFYPFAVAVGAVVVYYSALFVKQVILKKTGGLFTAKF